MEKVAMFWIRVCDPFKAPECIQMPTRTPELAISNRVQTCLRLFFDQFLDTLVFNVFQFVMVNFVVGKFFPSCLQFGWAQETADNVITEW